MKVQERFVNALPGRDAITLRAPVTVRSELAFIVSYHTRSVTFTPVWFRAPWFPTFAMIIVDTATGTATSLRIRTIARSSSTSFERSARIVAPEGETFRTFHPVRRLP